MSTRVAWRDASRLFSIKPRSSWRTASLTASGCLRPPSLNAWGWRRNVDRSGVFITWRNHHRWQEVIEMSSSIFQCIPSALSKGRSSMFYVHVFSRHENHVIHECTMSCSHKLEFTTLARIRRFFTIESVWFWIPLVVTAVSRRYQNTVPLLTPSLAEVGLLFDGGKL